MVMGLREAKSQNFIQLVNFFDLQLNTQAFTIYLLTLDVTDDGLTSVVVLLNIRPVGSAHWPTLN